MEAKLVSDDVAAKLRERGYVIKRYPTKTVAESSSGCLVVFKHGGWVSISYQGRAVSAHLSLDKGKLEEEVREASS